MQLAVSEEKASFSKSVVVSGSDEHNLLLIQNK
jgi:hypothetical protein